MNSLTYCNIGISKKNRYTNKLIDKKFKNKHRNRKDKKSNEYIYDSCDEELPKKRFRSSNKIQFNTKRILKYMKKKEKKITNKTNDNTNNYLVISTDPSNMINNKLFFDKLLIKKPNEFSILFSINKLINSNLFKIINDIPYLLKWIQFINKHYNNKLTKNKCFINYKPQNSEWFFNKNISIHYVNRKCNIKGCEMHKKATIANLFKCDSDSDTDYDSSDNDDNTDIKVCTYIYYVSCMCIVHIYCPLVMIYMTL